MHIEEIDTLKWNRRAHVNNKSKWFIGAERYIHSVQTSQRTYSSRSAINYTSTPHDWGKGTIGVPSTPDSRWRFLLYSGFVDWHVTVRINSSHTDVLSDDSWNLLTSELAQGFCEWTGRDVLDGIWKLNKRRVLLYIEVAQRMSLHAIILKTAFKRRLDE